MNDTHHFNSLENSHLPVLRWAVIGCGSICKNFVRALGIGNRNHQVYFNIYIKQFLIIISIK